MSETSMVDPARHTGLPERTLGELSETSLGKKYLIQTRTMGPQEEKLSDRCRDKSRIPPNSAEMCVEASYTLITLPPV